jgi:hypothetical protein
LEDSTEGIDENDTNDTEVEKEGLPFITVEDGQHCDQNQDDNHTNLNETRLKYVYLVITRE